MGFESLHLHYDGVGATPMATFTTTEGDGTALNTLGVGDAEETLTSTDFSLPPVDTGINAIMILISGFFVEGNIMNDGDSRTSIASMA